MYKVSGWIPAVQKFVNRYDAVILTALMLPAFMNIACRMFVSMHAAVYALNVAFYILLILAGIFITGSVTGGTLAGVLLCFVFAEADTKVVRVRGMPVTPSDLLAVKTAISVTTSSMVRPGAEDLLPECLFGGMALFILIRSRKKEKGRISPKSRIIGAACVTVFLSVYCLIIPFLPVYAHSYDKFDQGAKSGRIVSFLYDTGSLCLQAPEGYSRKEAEELLNIWNSRAEEMEDGAERDLPDIVVIMSEAFCDVTQINPDFEPLQPYIPYVKSMACGMEDTVSGYLDVSVIGGGTVNTEWEFLTGNSMHNIDSQSIPFQSYISDCTDLSYSLPAVLKRYGYELTFLHPYERAGYRRDYVYRQFGFDRMLFQDDFYYTDKVRGYVSDASLFAQIRQELDGKEKDSPAFIFAVSMQNHSFYEDTEETLKEYPDSFELSDTLRFTNVQGSGALNTYMTLENITDHGLEEFVDYAVNRNRPTIIVFFGDHQPSSTVTECITPAGTEKTAYFKVPFFITGNTGIDQESGITSSPNFLGNLLLENAGIPLNGYRLFLEQVRKKYPSVSAWQYHDADGHSYMWEEDPADSVLFSQYRMLQYFLMKDSETQKSSY